MTHVEYDYPHPFCLLLDHPARAPVDIYGTDISSTFARYEYHPNPSYDDYEACDAMGYLEMHGEAKP